MSPKEVPQGAHTAPTAERSEAPLSPGSVLGGRYRIERLLGRGGMGEVWQAYDLKLRVEVALKSILARYGDDPRLADLLRREVRAAREVISPNVCRIYDLVEADGLELLSMEYVDGTTLLHVLDERGPLELPEASEIALQLLAGLEAIHRAGLVHRDLKPENVMITRTGRVVVMDFGIAREALGSAGGTVAGTPAYMAPEQTRGEAVDARSDVFAAGVVLAEMVGPTGIGDPERRQRLWSALHRDPPLLPDGPWQPLIRRALAVSPGQRYPTALALARALEEVSLRVEGAEDKTPYPGLASFTEANAEYFYGREAEVEAVWKKLAQAQLLGVVGASGAGKSSFVRAGLIPARPSGWGHLVATPGSTPFAALAKALVPELGGDTEALQQIVDFERIPVALDLLGRWRRHHHQALLVVDQFEELFTLCPAEIQTRFAELLGRAALEADVRVLLVMRDDFLLHCHAHPPLAPLFSELTPLSQPSGEALRRAIVQPALACGYRFEDEALVDEMLAEVTGERAALPLLAFAAARLWEARDRERGLLTRAAHGRIGGVGEALAQHAEATLERIGRRHRPLVRELFRNLVTAQGTRAARDVDELLSVFDGSDRGNRDAAREALDELVAARLLTSYEAPASGDEQGAARVEIVHESLITSWPRLVRWRGQDEEGARLRDELRQGAELWQTRGRPEDLLWTGTSYGEFALWRQRYSGGLSATEESFARAMERRVRRARRRKQVLLAAVAAALLAVAATVTALWRQSEAERLRAEASKLLALGRLELAEGSSTAVAHALAALELADSGDARRFALEALWQGPTGLVLHDADRPEIIPWPFDISTEGRWLALSLYPGGFGMMHEDGTLVRLPRSLEAGMPELAGFDPDTTVVVTKMQQERLLRVFSVPDGEPVRQVELGGPTTPLPVRGTREILTFTADGDPRGLRARAWAPDAGTVRELGRLRRSASLMGMEQDLERWLEQLGQLPVTTDWRGERLFLPTAGAVASLSLAELETGALETEAPVGEDSLIMMAVAPDGERLATLSGAGTLRLWQRGRRGAPPLAVLRHEGATWLDFSPDGSTLATAGGDRVVRLWDLAGPAGAEPLTLRRRDQQHTRQTFFHPGGRWLATQSNASATVWPLSHDYPRVFRCPPGPTAVALVPGGSWVVGACSDLSLRFWGLAAGGPPPPATRERHLAEALAVSPDGRFVASAHQGVVITPLDSGPPRRLAGFAGQVWSVDIDPTGRLVAASGGQFDAAEARAQVWDLDSGATTVLDAGDGLWVSQVELPGDGVAFTAGPGGIRRWQLDTATPEPVWSQPAAYFDLSPDRQTLVSVGPGAGVGEGDRVVVHDLTTGASRPLVSHGDRVIRVALDAAGGRVVTTSADGTVRVGPLGGEEPHLLRGHEGMVGGLAFDPESGRIATAGHDGTVRVWQLPEGRPFHTLPYDELVARLGALTNFRVVADPEAPSGYRLSVEPFPGWRTPPTW